jgi:hypothetical protein
MSVKKHRLEMSIEEDFCLLGIVTDHADYKLCWLINQSLGWSLARQDDLSLFHRKLNLEQHFPLYAYTDEDMLLTYRIIGNRSGDGYFLDELKGLDFLVHIQGDVSHEKITGFIQAAGSIPGIRMCVPVDLARIRDMERLLLW